MVIVGKMLKKKIRWRYTRGLSGILFLAFLMSFVFLLVGLGASEWTLHSLPDLLSLFCGKMELTTNFISRWVYRKEGTREKKKTWTGIIGWTPCVCLPCRNLGLLGLVKKKEENNGLKTLDLMTNDRLDAPLWRADAQCFRMYVACACSLDSVDLQELYCCFVGRGAEKWLSSVTSCIYFWTELLICLFSLVGESWIQLLDWVDFLKAIWMPCRRCIPACIFSSLFLEGWCISHCESLHVYCGPLLTVVHYKKKREKKGQRRAERVDPFFFFKHLKNTF